ncbi:hypothetical protein Slin15195_G088420 [Septoria linicola]|uniref:Uncharacterized protein n=1 Tax=Septoria linicola TaxID=215465 RepID=A0A9Q9AYG4_9PEZI|nr:hypothetical protein Slin14017_G091050 [Septoria linicola]USW55523.1 hypothetical protein Slin15195_G088420 [Septoria linicola]
MDHCVHGNTTGCDCTVGKPEGWQPEKYQCDTYKALKSTYDKLQSAHDVPNRKVDRMEAAFLKLTETKDRSSRFREPNYGSDDDERSY